MWDQAMWDNGEEGSQIAKTGNSPPPPFAHMHPAHAVKEKSNPLSCVVKQNIEKLQQINYRMLQSGQLSVYSFNHFLLKWN